MSQQEAINSLSAGVKVLLVGVLSVWINLIADMTLLLVMGLGLFFVDPSAAFGALALFGGIAYVLHHMLQGKVRNFGQLQSMLEIASAEGISNAIASEMFARCRALATTTHFAHLSTDSFSEHTALATFYEEIVETVDKFCEAYIGLYGKFITLPSIPTKMQVAVDAIIEFRDWITKNRSLITDDSSLQNIIDDSVELCNTTIYKLQKLK